MENQKQMYRRQEVLAIIEDVLENGYNMGMEFESYLNNRGLNGNNGANEDLRSEFIEDFAEQLLDDNDNKNE